MAPLGSISRHLNLVRRMGQATGVDLAAAMHEGRIDSADWAGMVTNCRGCQSAETCDHWLDGQALRDGTARTPSYCENSATFARLARESAE